MIYSYDWHFGQDNDFEAGLAQFKQINPDWGNSNDVDIQQLV